MTSVQLGAYAEGLAQGRMESKEALKEVEKVLSALQRGAMPPTSFAHILAIVRSAIKKAG